MTKAACNKSPEDCSVSDVANSEEGFIGRSRMEASAGSIKGPNPWDGTNVTATSRSPPPPATALVVPSVPAIRAAGSASRAHRLPILHLLVPVPWRRRMSMICTWLALLHPVILLRSIVGPMGYLSCCFALFASTEQEEATEAKKSQDDRGSDENADCCTGRRDCLLLDLEALARSRRLGLTIHQPTRSARRLVEK